MVIFLYKKKACQTRIRYYSYLDFLILWMREILLLGLLGRNSQEFFYATHKALYLGPLTTVTMRGFLG